MLANRLIGTNAPVELGRLVFCALCLFLVFWIPWHVAVQPSVSESYVFGFSNRAFELLLLPFIMGFAISQGNLVPGLPKQSESAPIPQNALWGILAVAGVICISMCVLTHGLGGYDESRYLIDRISLLAEGKTPYIEFEFAYGPLLLYAPLAIANILHLGIETGYDIFWVFSVLLGYHLLYQTINHIDLPSQHKRFIFLVFSFGMTTELLSTGANYTLLRYVLPSFCALRLYRSFRDRQSIGRYTQALLWLVGTSAAVGALAPELGIAYSAGGIVFFAVYGRLSHPMRLAAYGVSVALLGLMVIYCDHVGVFDTMKDFAGGGFNFPVVPALHILLLVFCALLSTSYVVTRAKSNAPPDAITLVIATSFPALPAALGRCDAVHTLFCALGITLGGSLLASINPQIWRLYRYPFVLIVAFVPFLTGLMVHHVNASKLFVHYVFESGADRRSSALDDFIQRGMESRLGPAKAREKLLILKASTGLPPRIDIAHLFPGAQYPVWVPFGFSLNGLSLYHDVRLDSGRYSGFTNVVSERDVVRKISELEQKPDRQLVLPSHFHDGCLINSEAEVLDIRMLLLFPFNGKPKHLENILEPVCFYITERYKREQEASPKTFGYELWIPRNREIGVDQMPASSPKVQPLQPY